MLDTSVVAADIARLVQNSPQHKILGSELAVLLKRGYPDFRAEDFGCRNLREFVRRYVRTVFEESKKGTDVMYSAPVLPAISDIASRQQEFNTISAPAPRVHQFQLEKSVWKTFVSPNAPYRLYGNRDTGEVCVVPLGQPAPSGAWVIIPSCPAEKHEQIAREFLEGLSDEPAKTQLTKILGLDSWWEHFLFSARNFGVERQWSAFRRRRLHEEFQGALQQSGIPQFPVADQVAPPPSPGRVGERADAEAEEDESELKRIAVAVIRRLPDARLRELSLPLGYLLDVIGDK